MKQGADVAPARKPVDAEKVARWLGEAQPGARLIYFSGVFAGEGSARVNELLLAEEARGMVYLVQQRRRALPPGFDYLAIRSSRPINAGPRRRPEAIQEQAAAIFRGGRS